MVGLICKDHIYKMVWIWQPCKMYIYVVAKNCCRYQQKLPTHNRIFVGIALKPFYKKKCPSTDHKISLFSSIRKLCIFSSFTNKWPMFKIHLSGFLFLNSRCYVAFVSNYPVKFWCPWQHLVPVSGSGTQN